MSLFNLCYYFCLFFPASFFPSPFPIHVSASQFVLILSFFFRVSCSPSPLFLCFVTILPSFLPFFFSLFPPLFFPHLFFGDYEIHSGFFSWSSSSSLFSLFCFPALLPFFRSCPPLSSRVHIPLPLPPLMPLWDSYFTRGKKGKWLVQIESL